jgi:hypothetical protein
MKTKCGKTFLGFRKNCIGDKCALWVTLFNTNEKGETVPKGMCVHVADNIARIELKVAVANLNKK